MTIHNPPQRTIHTVAAVILDARQQVLLVRKQGSDTFIQPGGKLEPEEAPLAALARELAEELGVTMNDAQFMGVFEDWAVHEPGCRVRAQVYRVGITGEPKAQAEIAELRWLARSELEQSKVAPLSAKHILPALWSESVVPGSKPMAG